MAKKSLVVELSDEEILRVARMELEETSAATFKETELDTQLSVERGHIWLIHFIEFQYNNLELLSEVAAGAAELIKTQITRDTQSVYLDGNASDIIQQDVQIISRSAAIGTDAGPLVHVPDAVRRYDFPVPLPFASQSIYGGIQGTDATGKHKCWVRIGYTIRSVSDKFFFRVAQALLG